MTHTIRLTTPSDSIEFSGTNILGGWIYDNEALRDWFRLPEVESNFTRRANRHGTFKPKRLYVGAAKPSLSGAYFGLDHEDAETARRRLTGLFSEGLPITMEVEGPLGVERREVFLVEGLPEWTPHDHFTFDLAFVAPDPRRYGAGVTDSTALPSPSSGLTWDLGTAPSGLFFDWGTDGDPGQIVFENVGNTDTYPTFTVASGAFAGGFRITEIETGRELTFAQPVRSADIFTLDNGAQRARLNGSDVTGRLSRREWFTVPPKTSRRYQFATLGGVTGSPSLRLDASPAYL